MIKEVRREYIPIVSRDNSQFYYRHLILRLKGPKRYKKIGSIFKRYYQKNLYKGDLTVHRKENLNCNWIEFGSKDMVKLIGKKVK